jgi:membrane associated rhomboid family serine protease
MGIPNLMLYISLGTALVFLMSIINENYALYYWLCFDRQLILQGQVWRLVSYVLTYNAGNVLLTIISLFCYYSLGQGIENLWGTLRFNLFYFTGVILQDVFCMLFGGTANVFYLNLSLFLAYATMYPNAQFLIFFVIPVKAWILALLDLVLTLYPVITLTVAGLFPYSLFPLVALLNYFLFFGKDVLNVIPMSWRANFRRLLRKSSSPKKAKTIPFPTAGSYQATQTKVKAPYNHKCTICGRTDISDPQLEFRYCSRCSGYHCYCEDHISNHTHV